MTNRKLNLDINPNDVENSFDRIAKELLLSYAIVVNDIQLSITEIEFYYFRNDCHEYNYTHPHDRDAGEWRFHKQGLDLTLKGNTEQDGGILFRGVKHNEEYVNGPILTVQKIMQCLGSAFNPSTIYLNSKIPVKAEIWKTFRELSRNKISENTKDYLEKPYRYLVDIKQLKLANKVKDEILKNHIVVK